MTINVSFLLKLATVKR